MVISIPIPERDVFAEMVRQTQADNRDVISTMPCKAKTKGQRALQKKHGTPKDFARGCISAIGEISPLEAHRAIQKYHAEWEAA